MKEQEEKQNQSSQDSQIVSELDECKKTAEEYLNGWKRAQADFINYKKDEAKRAEEFVKFANDALILEILAIIDDLELAAQHEGKEKGLPQILKKFSDLLKKYDVEKIKTDGTFNPLLQEAIEGSNSEGAKIEELRAGYTLHGKVIRPARVKFTK